MELTDSGLRHATFLSNQMSLLQGYEPEEKFQRFLHSDLDSRS